MRRSSMSRVISTAFSLILAAVPVLAVAPERASAAPPQTAHARAREAYAAMQANYYLPDRKLFRELAPPRPGDLPVAYSWPYSQALAATLDVAGLPGGDRETLTRAAQLHQSYLV